MQNWKQLTEEDYEGLGKTPIWREIKMIKIDYIWKEMKNGNSFEIALRT